MNRSSNLLYDLLSVLRFQNTTFVGVFAKHAIDQSNRSILNIRSAQFKMASETAEADPVKMSSSVNNVRCFNCC